MHSRKTIDSVAAALCASAVFAVSLQFAAVAATSQPNNQAGVCAAGLPGVACPRWISVMPLNAGDVESISEDAAMLGNETIVDGIAWSFAVHPAGDPVDDKAAEFAKRYRLAEPLVRARSKVAIGVLLQATMGHGGMPGTPAKFQRVVQPNGATIYRMCPLDKGFLDYIAAACRTFSAVKPDFFMVDDDTRLTWGVDMRGCFCPLHLAEFGRRTGRAWTREEVVAAFKDDPETRKAWTEFSADTLAGLMKTIRGGFEASIPGIICVCATRGHIEYARRYAEILAAPGQKPTIRGNGAPFHNYGKDPLHVVEMRSRYARQLAAVGEGAVLMQEADTCPHTLWMCSATRLFDHMVMMALDGVKGAKIWITRTANSHERRSGRNYRRIFRENRGIMQWAADADFRQGGVVVPPCGPDRDNFGDLYLGLVGLPYRFGKVRKGEIVALTGATLACLSEAEIDEILSGRVILDGSAAIWLSAHGRSGEVGADAASWKLGTIQLHEFGDGHRQKGMRVNADTADLTRLHNGAHVLSRLLNLPSLSAKPVYVAPGAISFANARGGHVVTLAQPLPPIVPISYSQTLLTESYKRWIAGLLRDLGGGFPGGAYYLGDGPATLLSGAAGGDGHVFVLNLLDLDGDDAPEFAFDAAPSTIERMRGDGSWENVRFDRLEGNAVRLSTAVAVQMPAVFRVK